MSAPCAVIAGSRIFADALEAPLRMRFGAPPQLAADPAALIASGTGDGALVVVEYEGAAWLEAVRDLRVVRGDRPIAIVAAVSGARSGDMAALRSAGADEVVEYDVRMDPVLWAVDRVLAGQPRPPPVMARLVAGSAAELDDLADAAEPTEVIEVEAAPAAESPPDAPAPLADPPLAPADLPDAAQVEEKLAAALLGGPEPEALLDRAVRRFTAQLTDLERAAFTGAPMAVDGAKVRAAAALRFRVATVLRHARATGGPPEAAIAAGLPGLVDEALAALKVAGQGAPLEAQRSLVHARNALVAEAIQLTEALARVAEPSAEHEAVQAPPAPAAEARLLSNDSAADALARAAAPRFRPLLALAAVALLALGYHGWRFATRPRPAPLPTLAGAPANTYALGSRGGQLLKALPGASVDAAEMERFTRAQTAKGSVVRAIGRGVWLIEPQPGSSASPGGTKP